jgi:hypothetical protein
MAAATITRAIRQEARSYYRLVEEARALGVPVALDDRRTRSTVGGLREAVRVERRRHGR